MLTNIESEGSLCYWWQWIECSDSCGLTVCEILKILIYLRILQRDWKDCDSVRIKAWWLLRKYEVCMWISVACMHFYDQITQRQILIRDLVVQYWKKKNVLFYMHINLISFKSLQICAHKINTFLSHIVLTMSVFIWSKYRKTAILVLCQNAGSCVSSITRSEDWHGREEVVE